MLGGARSGKSRYAEQQALAMANERMWPVVYVATGVVTDAEMRARINLHRQNRPADWTTVEEPIEVAHWLTMRKTPVVVLLDCLSILLSNWLFDQEDDVGISRRSEELSQALTHFDYEIFVVSNEVGHGIVPDNALARRYRDALGRLNQQVAQSADQVILMVAGLPVDVRKLAP